MWLAHHFPGLHLTLEDVDQMTPEATTALRQAGNQLLKVEFEERWAHTKAIARAAASRGRL